jgi:hypothetical protein
VLNLTRKYFLNLNKPVKNNLTIRVQSDGHVGIGTIITGASQFTLKNNNASNYITTFLNTTNDISFIVDNAGATGINDYLANVALSVKGKQSQSAFFWVRNAFDVDKFTVNQFTTEVYNELKLFNTIAVGSGNDQAYLQLHFFNPSFPLYSWALGPQTATPNPTDNDFYFYVRRNGTWTVPGFIQDNVGSIVQMNFTGQHRSLVKDVNFNEGVNRAEDLEGMIVVSDQNEYLSMSGGLKIGVGAIMMNESLPIVSLSKKKKDKSVFGVISGIEAETREDAYGAFVTPYDKEEGDQRVYINSVGEGAVWIIDQGGDLEAGDYIISSDVPGYGMRQDIEFLANYTVAKITMDCNFDPEMKPVRMIKKEKKFIEEQWTEVNVIDDFGRITWEQECDADGTPLFEPAFKVRYLLEDGTRIEKSEYDFRKANGEKVYRAAFVGCTYHCG